jgi:hypothetical protein
LVTLNGRTHLYWLGGRRERPRLLHASVGRSAGTSTPQVISEAVDARAGWPVAAAAGTRVAVAWMSLVPNGYALTVAVLEDGDKVVRTAAVGPTAEESGRIAIIPHAGGWSVAWSQFADSGRRIWFVRLDSSGRPVAPARPVADGDGAALAPGARLFWWTPVGFDTYQLTTAPMDGTLRPRTLTGTISLPVVIPPIPLDIGGSTEVLLPVVERGFAAMGRLYALRVDPSGSGERVLLTPQSVIDVAAAGTGNEALVSWSAVSGRRRNSEIFAMLLSGPRTFAPDASRVSFTTEGSSRPSVAPLADGWVAAWLEVAGEARFRVVVSTATWGRAPAFLLGIAELNPRRPGRLLSFAAIVTASLLPYAALYAAGFLLSMSVLVALFGAVGGSFAIGAAVRRRPWLRCLLALVVVGAVELAARSLIPGNPTATAIILSIAVLGAVASPLGAILMRREGELALWAVVAAAVLIQMSVILFPWGARLLSQF